MTMASASSGWSSLKPNCIVLGSKASKRWMVLASCPVISAWRWAARPVGAARIDDQLLRLSHVRNHCMDARRVHRILGKGQVLGGLFHQFLFRQKQCPLSAA